MRRFAVIPVLCILAICVALKAQDKAKTSPLVGTWNCVAHGTEHGDLPFTLYIEQSAEGFTGSASSSEGETGLSTVTFKDNHLKITIDTDEHNYLLTATLADGKLAGEWSVDSEEKGKWEGKK
jgi:hypothetical protein